MATWHDLLNDVEAQAEALAERERDGRIDEQARLEWARTLLTERFSAAIGEQVQVLLGAAGPVRGVVDSVGPDWILLTDPSAGHEHLVRLDAISVANSLPARAHPVASSPVLDRLDAAWALRRLARDRAVVRVRTVDGQGYGGLLDRVGADHLDLVDDQVGPAASERARSTVVRLAAIAVVTRS